MIVFTKLTYLSFLILLVTKKSIEIYGFALFILGALTPFIAMFMTSSIVPTQKMSFFSLIFPCRLKIKFVLHG